MQEEKAGSRMPGRLLDPPAEGTTEEPMTIVDSVAREPTIIKCHQAEEFVSQDVMGMKCWFRSLLCPPCPYT